MKPFILCFSDRFASADEVQRYLDEVQEIGYWYRFLPNAILLTSSLAEKVLGRLLEQRFVRTRRSGASFILAEIKHESTWGLLSYQAWELIEKPETPVAEKEDVIAANYFFAIRNGGDGRVVLAKDAKGKEIAEFYVNGQSIGAIKVTDKNRGWITQLQEMKTQSTKNPLEAE
jgi:hypothetical protein